MFRLIWFMFALLAVVFARVEPAHAQSIDPTMYQESRVALVIGNSSYAASPLSNPVNDARLMATTLQSLGFRVILKTDANQEEMKRAIEDFGRELSSGGVGLFYYAGHGIQLNGRNFLVPIGANINGPGEVDIESVDVARVLAKMDRGRTRINLVILDACRNNPFASRGFRSQDRGLAFVEAPQGTLIMYATAPGKVAMDGDGQNGTYTQALAQEIQTPGTPIERVLKQVRTRVKSATTGMQVPWESSSLEGEFYFRLPDSSGAAAPPPTCAAGQVLSNGSCVSVAQSATPSANSTGAVSPTPDPGAGNSSQATREATAATPGPSVLDQLQTDTQPPEPIVDDPGSGQRTLGYWSIGLGLAGLALGGTAKILSSSPEETLYDECVDGRCPDSVQSEVDQYDTYKTLNTVGYIAGGALTGLGLVLLFTAPDDTAASGVQPYFTGTSGGLHGKF